MIYPYKWEVITKWSYDYMCWLSTALFLNGKTLFVIAELHEDKEVTDFDDVLWEFWRKRGAM